MEAERYAALVAGGWHRGEEGSWYATPGTGPGGHWTFRTAYAYLRLAESMRALAERGWDVPREYVGGIGVTTIGEYVKHPRLAPRFIRVATALRIEGLPKLCKEAASRA